MTMFAHGWLLLNPDKCLLIYQDTESYSVAWDSMKLNV